MPRTLPHEPAPSCRKLLTTIDHDCRWGFFMLENLLTARTQSMFPTNGAGPDEDVNVYLAHLLTHFLTATPDPRVAGAGWPLLLPPACTDSTWARADFYRVNADHRLLYLGLFQRGDGNRRRQEVWGRSASETRAANLAAGQACYAAAASHLRPNTASDRTLIAVWHKLALHFSDYVHVIGALATRQLGLGAKLDTNDLAHLIPANQTADAQTVDNLLQAPPPATALDSLLDLWLELQKNPDPVTRARVREMANQLGVQLQTGSTVTKSDNLAE